MCGRYALAGDFSDFTRLFELEETPGLTSRYNIAPSSSAGHEAPILTSSGLMWARFWYIPSFYSGNLTKLPTSFNARVESVLEKAYFRGAAPCLIPTTGFREFPGPKGHKRAVCFYLPKLDQPASQEGSSVPNCDFFAFGGIHSRWADPETGETAETFAILTTEPSPLIQPYHDRMPVPVARDDYSAWLAPGSTLPGLVAQARQTAHQLPLACYESSTYGNSTRVEGIECVAPARAQLSLFG